MKDTGKTFCLTYIVGCANVFLSDMKLFESKHLCRFVTVKMLVTRVFVQRKLSHSTIRLNVFKLCELTNGF